MVGNVNAAAEKHVIANENLPDRRDMHGIGQPDAVSQTDFRAECLPVEFGYRFQPEVAIDGNIPAEPDETGAQEPAAGTHVDPGSIQDQSPAAGPQFLQHAVGQTTESQDPPVGTNPFSHDLAQVGHGQHFAGSI